MGKYFHTVIEIPKKKHGDSKNNLSDVIVMGGRNSDHTLSTCFELGAQKYRSSEDFTGSGIPDEIFLNSKMSEALVQGWVKAIYSGDRK
jgi:hypothetical protein